MSDAPKHKSKTVLPQPGVCVAKLLKKRPDVLPGVHRRATEIELFQYNQILEYYDKEAADMWLTAQWQA